MARHRFHGDPKRFDVLAALVNDRWGTGVHYIADVAGGQGMLSRIVHKRNTITTARSWIRAATC